MHIILYGQLPTPSTTRPPLHSSFVHVFDLAVPGRKEGYRQSGRCSADDLTEVDGVDVALDGTSARLRQRRFGSTRRTPHVASVGKIDSLVAIQVLLVIQAVSSAASYPPS
jgi:hypothetical protein